MYNYETEVFYRPFVTCAVGGIRCGEWKMVYRMHNAALELYNFNSDLGERDNVAASHPDIVKRLAAELSNRLRSWNAPMPTIRATGKAVPMPDEL